MEKFKVGVIASKEEDQLNEETRAIINYSRQNFEKVTLINPHSLCYEFNRGEKTPNVWLGKENLNELDYLFVRGTKGKESAISLLVHTLSGLGCLINDPVTRFNVGFASKILSTVSRHEKGVGSSSYFAFNLLAQNRLLELLEQSSTYPLVGKPVTGSKGKGVEKIADLDGLKDYLARFNEQRSGVDYPLLLQEYVKFTSEYRVFVQDRAVLGMVLKVQDENKVAANAAQGGTFVNQHSEEIITFVKEVITDYGIYGLDIAIDSKGSIHLIEANRAPLWTTFVETTGIDIAKLQVLRASERLNNKSEDHQVST